MRLTVCCFALAATLSCAVAESAAVDWTRRAGESLDEYQARIHALEVRLDRECRDWAQTLRKGQTLTKEQRAKADRVGPVHSIVTTEHKPGRRTIRLDAKGRVAETRCG